MSSIGFEDDGSDAKLSSSLPSSLLAGESNDENESNHTSLTTSSSTEGEPNEITSIAGLARVLLSRLDVMSTERLRIELADRGLDTTGLKPILQRRLREYCTANELNDSSLLPTDMLANFQRNNQRDSTHSIQHNSDAASLSPSSSSSSSSSSSFTPSSSPSVLQSALQHKIFYGQVPGEYNEDNIRGVFEKYGTILELTLLRHKDGKSKGCGFVVFASRSQAELAIASLHGIVRLPGARKDMTVKFVDDASSSSSFSSSSSSSSSSVSSPSLSSSSASSASGEEYRVYIGYLSKKSTADDVRRIVSPFGDPYDIFLMTDRMTGAFSGVAFVKFRSRVEASRCIDALGGKYIDGDSTQPLQVRFARSKADNEKLKQQQQQQLLPTNYQAAPYQRRTGGTTAYSQHDYSSMYMNPLMPGMQYDMSAFNRAAASFTYPSASAGFTAGGFGATATNAAMPTASPNKDVKGPDGCNLFVYNVPETFSDTDLQGMFAHFGNVISTKVQRDLVTGASRGFGFVSYDNPASANAAIASMDGFMIGQRRLAVRHKETSRNRPY